MASYLNDTDEDDLFSYPGDGASFWAGQLQRDCFVAILAPEKTGKSMDLVDIAVRAAKARRRVAYFEAGDMTEKQVCRRFAARISRHPRRIRNMSFPCEMPYPDAIRVVRTNNVAEAEVRYRTLPFAEPLSEANIRELLTKFRKKEVRSNDEYIRLSCHSTGTLTVKKIESIIQGWIVEGWVPDVVIIDYADIIAAPSHATKMDERGQINATWLQMRALSQSLHCLLVTATQADADSYGRDLITRKNFSGDKRKLAHVTAMMGINMTAEEKRKGITRRNWIVLREGAYSPDEVIHVAGCLAVCNPWVVSAR
jgi:hypothetical protein